MIELRDVVGFEEYFSVSKDGRVFSKRTEKFLKLHTSPNGYKVVSTRIGGRSGKCYCLRVHRLVADAWVYNEFNKPFVNHIDGNKQNNTVCNLEWVTSAENSAHAHREGLVHHPKSYNNKLSKLTKDKVDYIKSVYEPYNRVFGARALSRKLRLSKDIILRAAYS